jgi:hypothetical protein
MQAIIKLKSILLVVHTSSRNAHMGSFLSRCPATSHHERLCIMHGTRKAFSSQAGIYCRCIIISMCVLQKEWLVLINFSWRKVIFRLCGWLVAPDAALFFLVHMIVMMALCPCRDHYLLCYCSQVLSTTRTVMFVAFFNEKSHSDVWSCWRLMLPCSFLSVRLWYFHSLLYSFTLNTTACNDVSSDSAAIVCSPFLCVYGPLLWSFMFDFYIMPSFEFRLFLWWRRQWNVWLPFCHLHVFSYSF